MPIPRLALTSSVLVALGSLACHRQPVLTTPASDQAVYATAYAERLRDVRTRFDADEERTRKSFEGLRTLPTSVPASNADELESVVREADSAGRSQPYVDEALRQEDVDVLMSENKNAIRRRIAGSVAFAAKERAKQKENECLKEEDVDALAGSAAAATDRAVDRQLEQRLRSRNPAHRQLSLHADELGEARVNGLEPKVDSLTRASFVANVRLHLYRLELDDLLDQEKAVLSTLERDEAAGRATLAEQGLSKSYRLAIEDQVAKDEAARQAIPNEVTAGKAARADLASRAETLQKDYRALVDGLLAELERIETSSPEKATPGTKSAPAPKPTPASAEPNPAKAAPAGPENPAPPKTTP
jgi:hypothetical protein